MNKEKLELSKQPGLTVYDRSNDKVFGSKRVHVNMNEIRMSRRTGDEIGLDKCGFIKFLMLGESWFLVVSDELDAYKTTRETKSRSGYRISARYMSRALLNSFKSGVKQLELVAEKTERYEYKGKPVYSLTKFEV